ncbi:helix-turn-helix transcriptional regulator [Leucobacter iarius]|uniref:Helix-turn-helix transcriptional regulator n=1 Tax=Leucobacter iarius TaxID=333963 RepID=A0ABN2LK92_9MICO
MYREVELPGLGVLWRSERSVGVGAPTVIPADGSADIILRDDELVVAGPSTRWLLGRGSIHGATIGLRFAPGLAGRALELDASELRDSLVPAADALAPEVRRRGERLLRALGDSVRTAAGERPGTDPRIALRARSAQPFELGALDWTAEALRMARRGATVTEAAARLGYSERQLQRRMLLHFGYGYTALRRVLRAERARGLLGAGIAVEAAATRTGYSDQAHLTREFGRIVGTTPARFVAANVGAAPSRNRTDGGQAAGSAASGA